MNAEGITRSAILLMSLGQEEAADVFRYLEPREVQRIGAAMAALRNITRAQVGDALELFAQEAEAQTGIGLDSSDYLRAVLGKALGADKAGAVLDRILGGQETAGIEGLKWMDAVAIAELIKKEHPQIIATVLVHLDPEQASEVIAEFTERLRNDVLLRIATLDGVQPVALRELDDVMRNLLAGGDRVKRSAIGGVNAAAEILNFMNSATEKTVIDHVRDYDANLAQAILDKMFTFESLVELDNSAIQLILKEVESEALIIAVKGAPPALRQKFLANMSKRAAELFAEDLDTRGPVRVSEVEEKQREILQAVRALAEDGQIIIGKKAEDAFVG
jgi:flagellar motor switch protein FliG